MDEGAAATTASANAKKKGGAGQKLDLSNVKSFDGSEPKLSAGQKRKRGNRSRGRGRKRKKKKKPNPEEEKVGKYARGERLDMKTVKSGTLKHKFRQQEKKLRAAAESAAKAEILLTENAGYLEAEGMERTYRFTQDVLKGHLDTSTTGKMLELNYPNGPYTVDFTRNGANMLLGGAGGHAVIRHWRSQNVVMEDHYRADKVLHAKFLHNDTMFATAQNEFVYIYDKQGTELHCLRNHKNPYRLEFLPFHFLIVSVGKRGLLCYQDASTGERVSEIKTKLGPCRTVTQNPHNAIVCCGHHNGTVTMWSPSMHKPVVKMQCHRGHVNSMVVDRSGHHLVTAGADGQVKIWDVRTYRNIHNYFARTPASSVALSQTGLLAVGYGPHVQVWKNALRTKQRSPYMNHLLPGKKVHDLQFCPYEDFLGVGHSGGFSSIVIPGAGEANFDSAAANPYESVKQRQTREVNQLLEKLQPEMIQLDPDFIGGVQKSVKDSDNEEEKPQFLKEKRKARGKGSARKRVRRKKTNIVTQKSMKYREQVTKFQKQRAKQQRDEHRKLTNLPSSALDRFR